MIREADIPTEPVKRDSTAPISYSIRGNSIPPEKIEIEPLTDAIIKAIRKAIADGKITGSKAFTILTDTGGYSELKIAARSNRYPAAERKLAQIIVSTCREFPDLEPHAGSAFADARIKILLRHQPPTGFEKKTNGNPAHSVDAIIAAIQKFLKSLNNPS